ncbi:DMT family transporter [Paucilactobacillus wasatchensis]|uniref:Quaternary ammonium compound-resistance protein n=1 Tax=Paucilactobacillus wasatchensis TaxID=1335616 RepID=A0A0D0Y7Q1_9LACO|nr:multidrug efflux SMR transporter [Paucilactobacillus wasatchensis]KIS04293.1 Quaternary ammonium compound-resistance protein [Paucilactobacillus wasatchensis]
MSWVYLVIAGLFEVVWATAMKLSNGFSHIGFSIATVVGMILSFFFLARATKILSLSLAYPVWTGIGAVGSVLIGVLLFKEQLSLMTWVFVILLVVSIVGIKISSGH